MASYAGISYCLMSSILIKLQIIDSGANDYIVCDERFLYHIHKSSPNTSVHLPNGNDTSITKIGDVKLNSSIKLKNVLILECQFNLIFVSKFCKNNSC